MYAYISNKIIRFTARLKQILKTNIKTMHVTNHFIVSLTCHSKKEMPLDEMSLSVELHASPQFKTKHDTFQSIVCQEDFFSSAPCAAIMENSVWPALLRTAGL